MVTAGGDITYTKAVLYGQDISHLTKEQVEGLTSIGDPLVTVPIGISDKNDDGNGTTVVLEATFQNSNLKADLPYKAVGFFAKKDDGDEKLVLVGVATDGAYLAATSPDGVSTDSLDIKIAVAVGDASNVTAVVDPAGSVTPATLNGAISKATHDLTDKINTKADKTDLDSQIGIVTKSVSDLSDTVKANKDDADKTLATKADKADLDPLATKADVASDVKTLNDAIDTKASQADLDKTNATVATKASTKDVNTQLATKANSKDVDSKIAGVNKSISDVSDTVKANKDATDQALATKADKTDVAKDIDTVNKSISSMSATITANQKATDTALDTKADKTTVNQELATKANSSDVDKKLDEKADKSSVDAKINAIDFSKIKFRKQYLTKSGIPSDKTWNATKNSDGSYTIDIYQDDWTAYKVASLLQAITTKADQSSLDATNKTVATKANSSDVYTKKQVDDAFSSRDATIATKADKATVDAEISKIDFTPYAKTADVNKEIKTVTDLANSKVDANYSYSKAELDKKLLALSTDTSGKVNADQVSQMIADKADKADVTKQIKTVTDLANSKVDATYSYSKAELDKKLLAVTTTADGKVGADQVAQMIAGKADKTYVDNQIATIDFGKIKFRKQYVNSDGQTADKTWSATKNKDGTYTIDLWQDDWTASKLSGVLAQLPNKADTSTVNAQIADAKNTIKSNVDNLQSAVNTKASQADFDSLKTLVNNVKGFNVDSFKGGIPTTDINKITDSGLYGFANQTLTNSPFSGSRWGLLFVLREYDNDANNIDQFITSNGNLYWRNISLTRSIYPSWKRFANDGDINSLQSAINTKANSSDLTALDKKAVKSVGIYPNNLHFESGSFNYWSGEVKASPDANGYALIDLTDDTPMRAAADQLNVMLTGLNHLQGKQTKESADANALSETGIYYCSSPAKNFPVSHWGTLVTSNGNGARASQLYFPDDNSAVWFRTLDGKWRGWVRLANIDDVNNAESSLTSLTNAVSNKVNVTVPLFRRITAGNTWNDILGASNGDTPVLVSIRDEGGANTLGNFSAAVAFGGGDTKGVLNVAYSDHTARIIGGNGNAPVWHEDIAWKSDISNLQNIINQQNQTIQSLTTRLTNAENEINYIKANYVEGRRFPASQEAQAEAWENEKPTRLAMIEK